MHPMIRFDITNDERSRLLRFERVYARWCVANEAAMAAEDALCAKARSSREGRGPAPDTADTQAVAALRAAANMQLANALQELRDSPL